MLIAIIDQNNKIAPLKTTWNDLTIKLIKKPATSFCPYMGRKIFFSQTKKDNDRSLSLKRFLSFKINFTNPREYHHKGNLIISQNNSEMTFIE